jgi:pimeloyl-ACP methyl ester carboxylesterase
MEPLFLTVAGQRLEYAWWGPRPGAGPTLVFLHEGLGCLDLWRDFPRQLSDATGLGAFAYSRLGYGRSDPVQLPRPFSYMHDEAALLPEVLRAAGVTEPLLVGHSDGASIAIVYAGSENRLPVRALILEAPHVFAEEFGLNTIAQMADEFRTTDLPKKLARYHGDNLQGAFWGWNRAWLDPAFRSWNIEEYLPRIRIPILALQGLDDRFGTANQITAIQNKAGHPVQVQMLAACGHSPHRDQPATVLESMGGFVRRLIDEPG